MPQLSDSELVVLTAACQRPDRCVFPVTAKLKGNAAGNVLKSLLNKGLIKEVRAKRAMLRRAKAATIDEIAEALSWQAHTVRGAIAGALKKKLGLDVTSEKDEKRGRIYRIAG